MYGASGLPFTLDQFCVLITMTKIVLTELT